MLFEYPNLECSECLQKYQEENVPLWCKTSEGCPVEEWATDDELTELVNCFLTAKSLYNATQDPKVQEIAFKKLGLYENPALHIKLEREYAKWNQQQSQLYQIKKQH